MRLDGGLQALTAGTLLQMAASVSTSKAAPGSRPVDLPQFVRAALLQNKIALKRFLSPKRRRYEKFEKSKNESFVQLSKKGSLALFSLVHCRFHAQI